MSTVKKTLSVFTAIAVLIVTAVMTFCVTPFVSASEIKGNTATQLVDKIGTGWNLGNTLDATGNGNSIYSETSWGNPTTTKAMIDAVKAQGFNTVRIPVSWGNHTSGDNFTIDSEWLARVKEVVNYCIDNDMYVILNIHHDTSTQYYYPSSTYKTQSVKFVKSIWSQVATYFKDYDQKLIFETLNEPRLIGSGSEWWFPVNNPSSEVLDSINTINTLNQTAVDAIRAAGGNNAERCIMVPGYCASIDGCTTPAFKLPTDTASDRLIVSVHAYTPYNFALNGNGTSTFSDDLKSDVDYLYNTIKSNFLDKGIPVIIGETSASNKDGNSAERVKWAQYYMGKSADYGVPCMLWDNNVFNGSDKGECHGHLKRSTLGWYDENFVDAVIKYGKKGEAPVVVEKPDNMTNVRAYNITGTSAVIGWDKNDSATSYIIEQYKGGQWTEIANTTATSYQIVDLKSSTTYTFRLKACKTESGYSAYSDYTRLALKTVAQTVPAVTGFKSATATTSSLALQWNKCDTASGYSLEQYKGGQWTEIANLPTATTSYNVSGLVNGTTYTFRIRAYTNNGTVAYGEYTKLSASTALANVSGFAKQSSTASNLTVKWNRNSSATGYVLEQYTGGKWVQLTRTTANTTTSYTVNNLKASTTYTFRIKAYKTVNGNTTETAYIRLAASTSAPSVTNVTGFAKKSVTKTTATLQWSKNSTATGYIVEQYKGGKWTQIAKTTNNTTLTCTASGLSANTTYTFRIRAYKTSGSSTLYSDYVRLAVTTAK
ncbi:MAG: cellulase family glycosylhydrolase [Ruminiclostridium sp.]